MTVIQYLSTSLSVDVNYRKLAAPFPSVTFSDHGRLKMELFQNFDDDVFTESRSRDNETRLISYNAKFCEKEVKFVLFNKCISGPRTRGARP